MKKPKFEIFRASNPFFGSKIKVYDIETLANCFLYIDCSKESFVNDQGEEYEKLNSFSICPYNNDLEAFVAYVSQLDGMVGFNNLSFDSQVVQYILENWYQWRNLDGGEIAEIVYEYAQSLINKQNTMQFHLDYPEFKLTVSQLDLYKIHHFDNKAKTQSLKGVQVNLNYWMVLEMPIDHKSFIKEDQLNTIEEYCINDTLSTKQLYIKSDGEINLRKRLKQLYNINCMNWSNSKIGAELCLKFYCEYTGKDSKNVRRDRTFRNEIHLKDCISDKIEFTTPIFKSLKERFEKIIITDTHSTEEIRIDDRGLSIFVGKGGVHASMEGKFIAADDETIEDIDVNSLYPSLIINCGRYPQHLGPEFLSSFKEKIVDVRLSEKAKGKNGDKYIIAGLKESANSVYGKSNDKYSFLYDPALTMSTTANGQLKILMLYESIMENIENAICLQLNTDSVTILMKKTHREKFLKICTTWEKKVNLTLEFNAYKMMYIANVNNYCAIYEDGKTKLKGCFEINKPLHKDCSFKVIQIALEKYIVNNTPIEQTIKNHKIVWDFFGRRKFKSNMKGFIKYIKDGKLFEEQTQKVTRYYVAEKGKVFVKRYSSVAGRDQYKEEILEKGFLVELCNEVTSENINDYKIDYKFYIKEAQRIIDSVEKPTNQLNLF